VALIIAFAVGGIVLILAEVFLPGGIIGGIGFICIGFSIYFSYREYDVPGLAISAVLLITAGILAWLLALRLLPKTSMGNDLFLNKTQKGYDTRKEGIVGLVGKNGTAISGLRPTGKVEIEGQKHDAVTEGEFIAQGENVLVVGVRSNQLIVENLDMDKKT